MSRTCATALALVNWKGVFYERYLLDRHVTALEGANGAGKTTVMIAAYVVLLPDLGRLRFTNLGETAATGGDRGLYGRLGESGRPSYAAMELALGDGTHIVAGVQLVRKSEPSLELTPFIVSGLDLQGSMKELLLVSASDHDDVPELDEVKRTVARLGGTIHVFSSAKDYFAALFDRGVNPLRLATDEERSKLHDMLRTSMTGGISRALTSELRGFLLKEETGLADTLVRMRANLEACRKTRIEIAEARALEHEITAIHSTGAAMFDASAAAVRAAAVETKARDVAAREEAARVEAEVAGLDHQRFEAEKKSQSVTARLSEVHTASDDRAVKRARSLTARAIAARAETAAREEGDATRIANAARDVHAQASLARDTAEAHRERARAGYERATRGLGDLQAGLEELHARAHAQRTARTRLAEARALLADPNLDEIMVEDALTRVRRELEDVDTARARTARDASLYKMHHTEHAAAMRALAHVSGGPVSAGSDGSSLYDFAREQLARLAALDQTATRQRSLETELTAARAKLHAASAVRVRAAAYEMTFLAEDCPATVIEQAAAGAERFLRACEDDVRAAMADGLDASRQATDARAQAEIFDVAAVHWETLKPALERLAAYSKAPVDSIEHIARVREALAQGQEGRRAALKAAEQLRNERVREAEALEEGGGGVAQELLAVRDALTAELFAARFETSSAEEAPWLEAALGPLAHALIVDDPEVAAEALSLISEAPETVWLVKESDVPRIVETARAHLGSAETIDVVVKEASALRITRKPRAPILGREARVRRARELHALADDGTNFINAQLEETRKADLLLRDASRLLAEALALESGDPTPKAAAARTRERLLREAEADAKTRALSGQSRVSVARQRLEGIRTLVGEAHVLLPHDIESQVGELEQALHVARDAAREIERVAEARAELGGTLDTLRHPAPTRDSAATADQERTRLEGERDRLFAAESALVDVLARKGAIAGPDLQAALANHDVARNSIEEQHATARLASAEADAALRRAEAAWELANVAWQTAEGERAVREATRTRLQSELLDAGGVSALEVPLAELDAEIAKLASERTVLVSRERELATSLAITYERRANAGRALAKAHSDVASMERRCEPANASHRAFEALAEAAGLTLNPGAESYLNPAEHLAEARAKRDLLLTRLDHGRASADGASAVRLAFAREGESPTAYLEAWLAARSWVMRRLPTQFADVADPAQALERLRADLARLADRVLRHEVELRGTSEDIARGIDVQLRKTAARVRRLNRDLVSVAFGSIGAIRVHVKRVERMELVLRALRGGEVQELLFQSDLPFEEALGEVFRRYGGGGKAGAQRILDYREYLDLAVEIQRRSSSDWEPASPTRLSTGEAIGVGAALMMVVLTEWERDANLLRSDTPSGTLRFLFLDEANRLSPDNLAVLFELCRSLDLQLLVAAPEVARAQGNTTYRLVRHLDALGREEVLVSGRRAVAPTDEASVLDPQTRGRQQRRA